MCHLPARNCCAASLLEIKKRPAFFFFSAWIQIGTILFFIYLFFKEKSLPPILFINNSIAKISIQKHLSICTAVHRTIILQEKAFVLANCHRLGIRERNRKHLNLQKKRDIPAFYQLPWTYFTFNFTLLPQALCCYDSWSAIE